MSPTMMDYSPLFCQGLQAIQHRPVYITIRKPKPAGHHKRQLSAAPSSSRQHGQGRSFLSFQMSLSDASRSSKRPTIAPPPPVPTQRSIRGTQQSSVQATASSTSTKPRSAPGSPTTPTSPSRRALPLPKPAPLAQLPAIPSTSTSSHARSQSSLPHVQLSSTSTSSSSLMVRRKAALNAHRKNTSTSTSTNDAHGPGPVRQNSLTMSARTMSTAVSTQYRKRRRQDALLALEGRPAHRSFVPSIVQEEPSAPRAAIEIEMHEDEDGDCSIRYLLPTDNATSSATSHSHLALGGGIRSHLSFSSWYTAMTSTSPSSAEQSQQLSWPTFVQDSSVLQLDLFGVNVGEPLPPRRKSEPSEPTYGWGETFIDLDWEESTTSISGLDGASSFWRWSHVA